MTPIAPGRPRRGPTSHLSLLEAETERFRNHAIGNNRLAHDWGHLWRNWVMKAALDAPPAARRPGNGGAAASLPSVRMSGPDGLWKIRLTGYRPGDPWKYEGDPPGGANCKVPAELIPHWRAYLRELEAVAVMAGRKPTCCRCGKLKERISRPYCRACTQAVREAMAQAPSPDGRTALEAATCDQSRGPVGRAGNCARSPAGIAASSRTERHHPDYARPLYVIWLCRPCHLKLHANRRRRARRHARQVRKDRRRR